MTKKLGIRSAVMAVFIAGLGVSGIAAAQVAEVEPNNTIITPQRLSIRGSTGIQITGSISVAGDVDFYSFHGEAGDVVTVDIDGGMTTDLVGLHSTLAILGPVGAQPPVPIITSKTSSRTIDTGSISLWDARLDNVRLPSSGTYIVAVAGYPTTVGNNGNVNSIGAPDANSTGNYTLIITGASPDPIQVISIDIKPGDHQMASPINIKSMGTIPVALLASADFDPMKVVQETLRFGHTGTETSLARCHKEPRDVNRDGLLDLVCHFYMQSTGFLPTDTEGILTGSTVDGTQIEGHGSLKVVPADERHHGRGDHDDDHDRGHDRDHDGKARR